MRTDSIIYVYKSYIYDLVSKLRNSGKPALIRPNAACNTRPASLTRVGHFHCSGGVSIGEYGVLWPDDLWEAAWHLKFARLLKFPTQIGSHQLTETSNILETRYNVGGKVYRPFPVLRFCDTKSRIMGKPFMLPLHLGYVMQWHHAHREPSYGLYMFI